MNLTRVSTSTRQLVQQPQPVHGGDIRLSPHPVAQPPGGADVRGHPRQVLQGLPLGGAERPAAGHRLRPGHHPHLSDPHHGQPGGAQDQERGRKLLRVGRPSAQRHPERHRRGSGRPSPLYPDPGTTVRLRERRRLCGRLCLCLVVDVHLGGQKSFGVEIGLTGTPNEKITKL